MKAHIMRAFFASYSSDTEHGYNTALLGTTPLENEATLYASERVRLTGFVLSLLSETKKSVVALIGDDISTNKALFNEVSNLVVGCTDHRFNLAVLQGVPEKARKVFCCLCYTIAVLRNRFGLV